MKNNVHTIYALFGGKYSSEYTETLEREIIKRSKK